VKRLLFVAGLILAANGGRTAPLADPNSPLAATIDSALTALYNLDHAKTQAEFRALADQYPDNPIGSYGLTTALWWELTNEFDETNPALEKDFLDAAQSTLRLTEKLMKSNSDPNGVARLCRGGSLGLVARWDALQGHWLAAYRKGKQAFTLQKEAIAINPALYDAYLGPGIFHYYVAVLPAGVKTLARMVFGGSKEQGLDEIRLAMNQGQFSKTAARLFLVNIYTNNEKDPDTALTLLREGRVNFPDSPFFHLVELMVLDEAQRWNELETGAVDFLARIDAGQPFYSERFRHRGSFVLANSFLCRGDAARAVADYDRILAAITVDDRWITMTYLNRGKAHDLLGQRERALADYGTVLKRRNVWGLHDQAKELKRRPYQGRVPGRSS
jgi:tetratricopeptide (TPR) repeat protein